MWGRILTIMKKELILILRDKMFLGMILIAPIILFIVLGYALNNDYKNIPTAIYNYQPSSFASDFILALKNSSIFEVKYFTRDDKVYQELMKEGKIKIAIGFPENIETLSKKNKNIHLKIVIDGSNSNMAAVAQGYLEAVIQGFNQKKKDISTFRIEHTKNDNSIQLSINILYNKNLTTRNYIIPALITIIILSLFPLLLGISINGEKEFGTLNQVLISKVKILEFFIGKIIPILLIEIFIILSLLIISIFWFGVPFKGSLILFLTTVFIFSITSLAVGFLMSSISFTRGELSGLNAPIAIYPAVLLSGFTFPVLNMPVIMQYISKITPARYSINIMRNIFLKASTLNFIIDDLIKLTLIGMFIFLFSLWNFTKSVKSATKGGG